MDLKKPEDTYIIPIMDLETSNLTSIMDTAPADAIPLSLEALDETPVSKEFETLVEENLFFDMDNTDDAEAECPEQKRIKLEYEISSFIEPEWHFKINTLKETVKGSQIIAAKDIHADGKKMVALFDSHQHLLDYIYRIPKEQRMIYEWILPDRPAKLAFDIDSTDPYVLEDPYLQVSMIYDAYFKTIEVLQELNLDFKKVAFAISDSSRKEKFSVHMVSNFYFESWNIQCTFMKKVFSEFIKEEKIDGQIYTIGGRGMRTILSTKFGKNSYLIPTENDQERYDRHKAWIDAKNNIHFFNYDEILMPKITEETHHLHHLITYVDEDYHYKIDVPQKYLKNVDKVKTQIEAGNDVVLEGLAQLVAENAEKFKDYVEDYMLWISAGIKFVIADLPYECFQIVSMQSAKFKESDCSSKWKNLQSSYGHEQKDVNQLKKFMKYIRIDVSIDYSYKTNDGPLDFQFIICSTKIS